MERESIIFYRSWVEAIEEDIQDESERQAAAWAILRYGIHGIESKMTAGASSAIFRLAKQTINANNRKYVKGCEGGRPKADRVSEEKTNGFSENKPMVIEEKNHRFSEEITNGFSEKKPMVFEKNNQWFSEEKTNGFSEDKPIVIEENNHRFLKNKTTDTDPETETDPVTVRGKKFVPPTLEEVKAYCEERKNTINPQRFIDFYTGKGWMIGKNKMKDWKAAVRTWEETERPKPTAQATVKPNSFSQFPQRDRTDDYFADLERKKLSETYGKRNEPP